MAASLRRNISFPAPRPSHPGARKRRQRITNQPSISSPTTAAAVIPRSSTAFGSQRSSEKHPSPQPLPRQIPIDDQALIALPRVRSSEAFGRRSPYTGSNARVGPASETLNDSGPSRLSRGTGRTGPQRTFSALPTAARKMMVTFGSTTRRSICNRCRTKSLDTLSGACVLIYDRTNKSKVRQD